MQYESSFGLVVMIGHCIEERSLCDVGYVVIHRLYLHIHSGLPGRYSHLAWKLETLWHIGREKHLLLLICGFCHVDGECEGLSFSHLCLAIAQCHGEEFIVQDGYFLAHRLVAIGFGHCHTLEIFGVHLIIIYCIYIEIHTTLSLGDGDRGRHIDESGTQRRECEGFFGAPVTASLQLHTYRTARILADGLGIRTDIQALAKLDSLGTAGGIVALVGYYLAQIGIAHHGHFSIYLTVHTH